MAIEPVEEWDKERKIAVLRHVCQLLLAQNVSGIVGLAYLRNEGKNSDLYVYEKGGREGDDKLFLLNDNCLYMQV
jgi:hypothetical protein